MGLIGVCLSTVYWQIQFEYTRNEKQQFNQPIDQQIKIRQKTDTNENRHENKTKSAIDKKN